MPYLDLTAETVSGARRSRLTLATIEAVMLWPDNEERRKEYLAAVYTDHSVALMPGVLPKLMASDPAGASEWMPEMFKSTRSAPRISDLDEARRRFMFGTVSGVIVIRALSLPGLTLTAIKEEIAGGLRLNSISVATINNKIWPRPFRAVAHLWAAFQIRSRHIKNYDFPCPLDDLGMFLAVSEQIRIRGQSQTLTQYNGMLLVEADSWSVPGDVPLPATQIAMPT